MEVLSLRVVVPGCIEEEEEEEAAKELVVAAAVVVGTPVLSAFEVFKGLGLGFVGVRVFPSLSSFPSPEDALLLARAIAKRSRRAVEAAEAVLE